MNVAISGSVWTFTIFDDPGSSFNLYQLDVNGLTAGTFSITGNPPNWTNIPPTSGDTTATWYDPSPTGDYDVLAPTGSTSNSLSGFSLTSTVAYPTTPLQYTLYGATADGSSVTTLNGLIGQNIYNWDPTLTNSANGFGTGTWNTTTGNWFLSGSGDTTFGNNGSSVAVLGGGTGGPYTVSVASAIHLNALTFNTAGYTVANVTGGSLTFDYLSPTITVASGVTGTVSSVINASTLTSNNGLTKDGPGTLVLTNAANTYAGGTTLLGGVLNVNAPGVLGAAAGGITFGGSSTLQAGATLTLASTRAIAITDPSTTATFDSQANTLTAAGVISGAGSLIKIGSGTLILSGNNTYTGDTTVNVGTLAIASHNGATSGTATADTITVNSGATLQSNVADAFGYGAATAASIVLNGATLTTAGGSNFRTTLYNVELNAGTITGGAGNVGDGNGVYSFYGSPTITVDAAATSSTINAAGIGIDSPTVFDVADGTAATDLSVASALIPYTSTSFGITKVGAGLMLLSGANTFTGGFAVNGGTVQAGSTSALGAATNAVTVNGGTLNIAGFSQSVGPVTLTLGTILNSGTSTATLTGSAYSTLNGTISANLAGTGALTQSSGTTILSGTNTYTGATSVASGDLRFSNTASLPAASAVTVASGASIELNASGTYAQNFTLSGSGSGTAATSGGTTRGALGYYGGGNVTETFTGGISLPATATFGSYGVSDTYNFNSIISGAGGLSFNVEGGAVASHTATYNFNAANTYAGDTTLDSGSANRGFYVLGVNNALPTTTIVTESSGGGVIQLNLNGHSQTLAGLTASGTIANDTVIGAGLLTINNAAADTFAGILSNTGGVTKSAAGTLILSGVNTYSGGTTIGGGLVQMSGTGTLGAATNALTINTGGALDLNGTSQTANALGGTATGSAIYNNGTGTATTLTVGNGNGAGTFGGNIVNNTTGTGTVAVTKTGTGTQTLAGANTYTGATTVSGGTLALTGSLGATAIAVNSTGTFNAQPGATTKSAASLTLNAGSGFSMVDNAIGIFNLTGAGTDLTIGAASGTAPLFNFEIGNAATGTDRLTATAAASVLSTGGMITITSLAANTTLTPGAYNLITATGGLGTGFTLNTTSLTVGGTVYNLSLTGTTTAETLNVATTALLTAYWTGSQGSSWNTVTSTNTNFATDHTGTTNTHTLPVSATNVFFTADTAGNLATTLGQNFTINSLTFTGTGTQAAASPVTIASGGAGTNSLTLNAGLTVQAGSNAHTISAPIVLDGSQTWTNSGTNVFTASGTVAGAGNALTLAGSGAQTLSGIVSGTGTALIDTATGTVTLSGANTYTGGTTLNAGTLAVGTDTNLGAAPGTATTNITFGGGTLKATTGFTLNANRSLSVGASGGTIDVAPSQTLNFAGVIGGTGVLSKIDTGTLTLTGTAATLSNFFPRFGTTVVDTGGNIISTFYSSVGQLSGDSGTLTVQGSGQYTSSGDLNVGDTSGSTGVMNVSGTATVNALTLYVGKSGTATGTVNQSGSIVQVASGTPGDWRIGGGASSSDAAAVGNYNLSGGTLNTGTGNLQIGAYGTGTLTQTGGTTTTGSFLSIGRFAGGVGTLDMSSGNGILNANTASNAIVGEAGNGTLLVGGTSTFNAKQLSIAAGNGTVGTGVVTQTGGTINATTGVIFGAANLAGASVGTYNLNGGVLATTGIAKGTGGITANFNLNGGTLRATAASANFLSVTTATVKAGSSTIDTQANNITIAQPLLHDSTLGATSDGGLTKAGSGILTLTGANTYTGATTISAGTLKLGGIAAPVTISNYSFETPTVTTYQYNSVGGSWTFTTQSGIDKNHTFDPNVAVPDGAQAGFIQQVGSIQQTIAVGSLGSYSLGFYLAGRPTLGPDSIKASIDGTQALLVPSGSISTSAWTSFSVSGLILTAGSHTLQFLGTNDLGGDKSSAIDLVTLNQNVGNLAPTTAVNLTASGATLDLNGTTQTVASLTGVAGTSVLDNGVLTTGDTTSTTFAGTIAGAGMVIKQGTGTQTFTGANTYTSGTTITAGTLSGTTSSFGTGGIGDAGTLDVTQNTSGTLANTVTGSGRLTVGNAASTSAGAIVTLTAGNTYTGGTTVNGGTLSGGTANYASGSVTVNSGATLDYTQNTTTTYAAAITGSGSVTVGGNTGSPNGTGGTITYTGIDSASGGTTVKAGTLTLNHAGGGALTGPVAVATGGAVGIATDNQIAPASNVTLAGGALAANGHSEGTATTAGMGTLQVGNPTGAATASTLNFGDATGTTPVVLSFSDSSTLTWNGTVTLTNYTDGVDKLYIGTTNDLTTTQLSSIKFGTVAAGQLSTGQIVFAPEPSGLLSLAVGGVVLGGIVLRRRRKAVTTDAA